MPLLMQEVEDKMRSLGATVIKEMDDGNDLDACLMRFNLPEKFDASSSLDGVKWAQVAQRISRSEDAMCRWEVVSNDPGLCAKYNGYVREITDRYVNAGWARY
ncbi:MAG: hypothetical protein IKR80_04265 [Spirochaetales bacterium]|nr:hypothetical protein [Spirochaetales bacterium]